jgi:hypothetical protein
MTIHLQNGALPWLGSRHAEMVEELHVHDIPLVSLVRLDDKVILSRCVVGEVEPVNVWTYTSLPAGQLALIQAVGPDDFDELVTAIAQDSTHVAVAVDGDGIITWTEWHDWPSQQAAIDHLSKMTAEYLAAKQADLVARQAELEEQQAELNTLTSGAAAAQAQAERLLEAV